MTKVNFINYDEDVEEQAEKIAELNADDIREMVETNEVELHSEATDFADDWIDMELDYEPIEVAERIIEQSNNVEVEGELWFDLTPLEAVRTQARYTLRNDLSEATVGKLNDVLEVLQDNLEDEIDALETEIEDYKHEQGEIEVDEGLEEVEREDEINDLEDEIEQLEDEIETCQDTLYNIENSF